MAKIIIHNHTIDKSIQQLHDTTIRHQTAINSIQATLAVQQNDIAAIRTSINHMIRSVSEIATKLGFQISLPPPLPIARAPSTPPFVVAAGAPTSLPVVAVGTIIPSLTLDCIKLDSASPTLTSIPTHSYATGSEIEPAPHEFNEALLLGIGGFGKVCKEDMDGESMRMEIKRGIPMSDQIWPEIILWEPALYLTLLKEREGVDAHNVFVEMNKPPRESKIFIFDPGGTINIASIFDLEDKVDFKGSVMIWLC